MSTNLMQIAARLLAARLDARLAAGTPPGMSRLLAARADDLVSPRSRRALADHWDRVLDAAQDPRPLLVSAAVPPAGDAVRAARTEIRALQARLLAGPVDARGAALARELLTDGAGPVYRSARPELPDRPVPAVTARPSLADAVRSAREALDPPGLTVAETVTR